MNAGVALKEVMRGLGRAGDGDRGGLRHAAEIICRRERVDGVDRGADAHARAGDRAGAVADALAEMEKLDAPVAAQVSVPVAQRRAELFSATR